MHPLGGAFQLLLFRTARRQNAADSIQGRPLCISTVAMTHTPHATQEETIARKPDMTDETSRPGIDVRYRDGDIKQARMVQWSKATLQSVCTERSQVRVTQPPNALFKLACCLLSSASCCCWLMLPLANTLWCHLAAAAAIRQTGSTRMGVNQLRKGGAETG